MEWSEVNHAAEGDRVGHAWHAVDAAFSAIDASQFFQPQHPAAEELPAPCKKPALHPRPSTNMPWS